MQEDLISKSPDFIVSFLKAHEDACNLIRQHPEQAARIAASEMGVVDTDFVLKTYSISPRYCAALPPEYVKSTMDFIPVLKSWDTWKRILKRKMFLTLILLRRSIKKEHITDFFMVKFFYN